MAAACRADVSFSCVLLNPPERGFLFGDAVLLRCWPYRRRTLNAGADCNRLTCGRNRLGPAGHWRSPAPLVKLQTDTLRDAKRDRF